MHAFVCVCMCAYPCVVCVLVLCVRAACGICMRECVRVSLYMCTTEHAMTMYIVQCERVRVFSLCGMHWEP